MSLLDHGGVDRSPYDPDGDCQLYAFVLLFRPTLGNTDIIIIPASYVALHRGDQCHYPHDTKGETEAQEDEGTCPRSASGRARNKI